MSCDGGVASCLCPRSHSARLSYSHSRSQPGGSDTSGKCRVGGAHRIYPEQVPDEDANTSHLEAKRLEQYRRGYFGFCGVRAVAETYAQPLREASVPNTQARNLLHNLQRVPMSRRVSFTIKFSTDLDSVPSWGYHVSDWIKLVTADFERQKHYNTAFEVIDIRPSRDSARGSEP